MPLKLLENHFSALLAADSQMCTGMNMAWSKGLHWANFTPLAVDLFLKEFLLTNCALNMCTALAGK